MKCITMETIKETELNATKKAELISIGSVQVDKSLFPDHFKSTATAGPGAGGSSIFLRSGSRRVRLTINDLSPLRVVPEDEPVSYTHLRAHETDSYLVCRLLLEKKKKVHNDEKE